MPERLPDIGESTYANILGARNGAGGFLRVAHNDDGTVKYPLTMKGPLYDVKAYGALGDGSNDDTTAIQAAIDAVAALGGGIVHMPAGTYKITAFLNLVDKNGVVIRGSGASNEPYSAVGAMGTIISWFGSAGGTMVKTGASASATQYGRGQGLECLTLDGRDVAGTGLLVTSGWFHRYHRVHVKLCTTVHIDITTIPVSASIGEDTQFCVFEQVTTRPSSGASASAIGLRCDSGATPSATQGNTSLNDFIGCVFGHYNGTGIELRDSDSNHFLSVATAPNGGSGLGIDLKGSAVATYGMARSNTFYFYDPGLTGGVTARGTTSGAVTPSANNRFINLSVENNPTFTPTIEAGATMYWSTNRGSHDDFLSINANNKGSVAFWGGTTAASPSNGGGRVVHLLGTAAAIPELKVEATDNSSFADLNLQAKDGSGNAVRFRGLLSGPGGEIQFGTTTNHAFRFRQNNTTRFTLDTSGSLTFAEALNVVLGTTTGTKIGTATTQKLGFWNKTPVVQPSAYTPTNVTTDKSYNADATSIDELADVLGTLIADLQAIGLIG